MKRGAGLRQAPWRSSLTALTLCACALAGDASATERPIGAASPATPCAALGDRHIPPAAIGLPTLGASVSEAVLVPADKAAGMPEYCRVRGSIAATRTVDPPILFEVNLPTQWNGKAVQFGGGGFNGTLITGLGNVPHSPSTAPTPLERGYATFGGDSGHSTSGGSFLINAQALANYSGESVKRTHDAALALMRAYYQSAPHRTYYVGGSKGGHEGLVAAQRYGRDYDGVIAYYPAKQNPGLPLAWFRMWEAVYRVPGAWMNPAKQDLLKARVLQACDALDGAMDGVISNLQGCRAAFKIGSLRCPGGADTGDTCLSDAQIGALRIAASPMQFAFPLAYGVTSMGPFPVFEGGDIGRNLYDVVGTGTDTSYNGFDDPTLRYAIQQNANATTVGFDYRAWRSRVLEISRQYDATNPDIDVFKARGGKLLLVQGTTDMLAPPASTTAYFDRLRARYGGGLKSFVRYYVQPGFGHAGGTFSMQWDSLTALENWVEKGLPPSHQIAADAAAPTLGRTRPLCEYPGWPRYRGTGDVNEAASFTCID